MKKHKLPTGIVEYRKLHEHHYYIVDKTMMIQEFLELGSEVTMIIRPRRFGKTLNLNMMAEFFDITKDSKEVFQDTRIMHTNAIKEMNQYPTIFISFANCKGGKEYLVEFLFGEIRAAYEKYEMLFDCERIGNGLRERVQESYQYLKQADKLMKVTSALKTLCEFLSAYYQRKVMLFIDEYDTPFIEAHIKKYYDEVHDVLAGILRTSLKDNEFIQYAMLTGIQRVAKENIFSDLNNVDVYTVKDRTYAEYFGFTKDETKELLAYYDLDYNKEVIDMYDGYRIGDIEIYNPWSIINYAKHHELRAYWVNTGSNTMIKKAMEKSDASFKEGFETLIVNKQLTTIVNMETSFYEQSSTSSLWGLFVNAGYLTIDKVVEMNKYRIRIPNKEVVEEFKSLTANYMNISETTLEILFDALKNKQKEEFLKAYESVFLRIVSYHDVDAFMEEKSYHLIMLGMCMYLESDYTITSNKESGRGRSDILLKAKSKDLPSFVIEFKYTDKETYKKKPESLKGLAQAAIQQIQKQQYDVELTGDIVHIGFAHSGKNIEMVWKDKDK